MNETVSDDGNFPRSAQHDAGEVPSAAAAAYDAREFPQSSSLSSDDEALIDVTEDEPGAGRWFNGLQVYTELILFFWNKLTGASMPTSCIQWNIGGVLFKVSIKTFIFTGQSAFLTKLFPLFTR